MQYKKLTEYEYMLSLSRGEKVIDTLIEFCRKQKIEAGALSGIGAVMETEIAYYDLEKKEYLSKTYEEAYEVLSLSGNISLKENEPFVHAHIILGGRDMETCGGHLKEATVAVVLEVIVRAYPPETLVREYNNAVGLHTLAL